MTSKGCHTPRGEWVCRALREQPRHRPTTWRCRDVAKSKRVDDLNAGSWCPVCHRPVAHFLLVAQRSNTNYGPSVMCDACADLLRAVNGFKQQGRRNYESYYEQEQLDLDQIAVRVRGYRLTVGGYLNLLKDQDNKCAICRHRPRRTADLVIDHNHKTGEVRGLLCGKCNTALGLFRDSPDVLDAAIEYLEQRGCYGLDSLHEETA